MQKNDKQAVEKAFEHLLEALELGTSKEERVNTAQRSAALWCEELLAGRTIKLETLFQDAPAASNGDPVLLTSVGIHLVCPHHLTIATGLAHLAYTPGKKLAGLGTLNRLIRACTARGTLQEDAGQNIVQTLISALEATSAVVCLEAKHPCLSVLHPNAQNALTLTWSSAGHHEESKNLRALLQTKVGTKPAI